MRSFQNLKDQELLNNTKSLVEKERQMLTEILYHLREVERRKLFCDLGYQSLFEYGVKELKYSEGQMGRRLQAMRLLKELPEVESKIQSGALSLSNISQAQSFFREQKKQSEPVKTQDKIKVLRSLENKSTREGQKILLQISPEKPLPKERQRLVTPTHTEVNFIMTERLKEKIETVKSFLGAKALGMSLAELIEVMTDLSIKELEQKKFGKRRCQKKQTQNQATNKTQTESQAQTHTGIRNLTYAQSQSAKDALPHPAAELEEIPPLRPKSNNPRYISQALKHHVWQRDKGGCRKCGSKFNLNFDHLKPVALGGPSTAENLRLLCFECNQRERIKTFGNINISY